MIKTKNLLDIISKIKKDKVKKTKTTKILTTILSKQIFINDKSYNEKGYAYKKVGKAVMSQRSGPLKTQERKH